MLRTRVGYAGGKKSGPTYEKMGDHTETIQVDYDPARIRYEKLLEVFFATHTPTRPSFGRQYRSVILTHGPEQARQAKAAHERLAKKLGQTVHTAIEAFTGFTRAEDYHQKFFLQQRAAASKELRKRFLTMKAFVDSTAAARLNGIAGGYGDREQLGRDLPDLGIPSHEARALIAKVR